MYTVCLREALVVQYKWQIHKHHKIYTTHLTNDHVGLNYIQLVKISNDNLNHTKMTTQDQAVI